MNVDKLNVSQICSVKIFIKAECSDYEYLKKRKLFFWTIRKEGFYYSWSFKGDKDYISIKEIESNGRLFCDGTTVYYKPHIEIRMSNQTIHNKFFENENELNDFMESGYMRNVIWINKNK